MRQDRSVKKMNERITKFLQKNGWAITVSVIFVNLAWASFNVYITSQLTPLATNIAILASEVKANDDRDGREHAEFVTHQEFSQVVSRLDKISARLDDVVRILINK